MLSSVLSVLAFSTSAYAAGKACNTYSISDFIPISNGSLVSGKLITPVNVKKEGSVFVIALDGNVSFPNNVNGLALTGQKIKVPDFKNCLAVGRVSFPSAPGLSQQDKVPELLIHELVCPQQIILPGQYVFNVVHFIQKPAASKINPHFAKNLPAGSKVQIFSSTYSESLCDDTQGFILNNIGQGAAFKYGVLSGCSGHAVLPLASSSTTNVSEFIGSSGS